MVGEVPLQPDGGGEGLRRHDVVDLDEGAQRGHALGVARGEELRTTEGEIRVRVALFGPRGVGERLGEDAGPWLQVGVTEEVRRRRAIFVGQDISFVEVDVRMAEGR